MKVVFKTVLTIMLMSVFLLGCNIFSFTAPENSASDLADGWEAYRDGNYQEAVDLFSKVIEEEPSNASARMGRAKAAIRGTGETSISLISNISQLETNPAAGDSTALPFMDSDWPDERCNGLYQAMIMAKGDLFAIYSGEAMNEEIQADDIEMDYIAAMSIHGILTLRDTNQDQVINSSDFNVFALFQPGGDFEFSQRAEFDAMSPEDQAALLGAVIDLLQNGQDALLGMLADTEVGAGIDTEALDGNLNEILGIEPDGQPTGDGISEYWPPTVDWPY